MVFLCDPGPSEWQKTPMNNANLPQSMNSTRPYQYNRFARHPHACDVYEFVFYSVSCGHGLTSDPRNLAISSTS
eukprot:scaffold553954_cov18-Prasinocladus_malaysianus.AAC.1